MLSGEAPSDKELGRQLMEVVQSIPNLDGDTITNMLNSHMQVQFFVFKYSPGSLLSENLCFGVFIS